MVAPTFWEMVFSDLLIVYKNGVSVSDESSQKVNSLKYKIWYMWRAKFAHDVTLKSAS